MSEARAGRTQAFAEGLMFEMFVLLQSVTLTTFVNFLHVLVAWFMWRDIIIHSTQE